MKKHVLTAAAAFALGSATAAASAYWSPAEENAAGVRAAGFWPGPMPDPAPQPGPTPLPDPVPSPWPDPSPRPGPLP